MTAMVIAHPQGHRLKLVEHHQGANGKVYDTVVFIEPSDDPEKQKYTFHVWPGKSATISEEP